MSAVDAHRAVFLHILFLRGLGLCHNQPESRPISLARALIIDDVDTVNGTVMLSLAVTRVAYVAHVNVGDSSSWHTRDFRRRRAKFSAGLRDFYSFTTHVVAPKFYRSLPPWLPCMELCARIPEFSAPGGLESLNFYWMFASLNARIVTPRKFYILWNHQSLSLSSLSLSALGRWNFLVVELLFLGLSSSKNRYVNSDKAFSSA